VNSQPPQADQAPNGEGAAYIEALLAEIRARLEGDTKAPQ